MGDNQTQTWLRSRFLQHRGNCDVVRQQLKREVGIEASLRTVARACRPLRQELKASRRTTVRFETAPGEQMQIDFGHARVMIGTEPVRPIKGELCPIGNCSPAGPFGGVDRR